MTFPSLHTELGWALGQAPEEQAAWTGSKFRLHKRLKESKPSQIMIRSHTSSKAQATSSALITVPITSSKCSAPRARCREGLVGRWPNTTPRTMRIQLGWTNLIIPIGRSMNFNKFLPATNTLLFHKPSKTEILRWRKCTRRTLACLIGTRIGKISIRCRSNTSTIRILKTAIQCARIWARVKQT